jgi:hypothetical protein
MVQTGVNALRYLRNLALEPKLGTLFNVIYNYEIIGWRINQNVDC